MEKRIGWAGKIKLRICDAVTGGVIDVIDMTNQITDTGRAMLRDILAGDISDGQIKYLAWGSDNTAVAAAQTALISEFGRKAITLTETTDDDVTLDDGEVRTTVYIAPYEANALRIEEWGWFAGTAATSTTDTGIMVARVLYSRQKTNLESIQVEREDALTEA